jgi:hypothetical protein
MSAMEQPSGLIEVLTDLRADVADRDDAAIDLHGYDEPEVLTALLQVGRNKQDPEVVLESVGESIAEILLRNGHTWWFGVDELAPAAQAEFKARMEAPTG